jgi:beta-xylosidase
MVINKVANLLLILLTVILGIMLYGSGSSITNQGKTETTFRYCNPIIDSNLADPFILRSKGNYYLFATGSASDGHNLPIYRSSDLINWQFVRGAVARGLKDSWNRRNFWAPEVIEINGQFCLYYTASTDNTPNNTGNRVGLAVSDNPEGPYEDRGVVIPHASLDGSPFRDVDGTLYLYYTIENGNSDGLIAGRIYVDKLLSSNQVSGNPILLISHHKWQEGPCVLLRNGRYYLTYSTGGWASDKYEVHWAVGTSPTGPFKEQPGTLLKSTEYVKGPGHHNFFIGPGGYDWVVYHGWDPKFTARYPRIDPLIISKKGLSTTGPTSTPQSIEVQ